MYIHYSFSAPDASHSPRDFETHIIIQRKKKQNKCQSEEKKMERWTAVHLKARQIKQLIADSNFEQCYNINIAFHRIISSAQIKRKFDFYDKGYPI